MRRQRSRMDGVGEFDFHITKPERVRLIGFEMVEPLT